MPQYERLSAEEREAIDQFELDALEHLYPAAASQAWRAITVLASALDAARGERDEARAGWEARSAEHVQDVSRFAGELHAAEQALSALRPRAEAVEAARMLLGSRTEIDDGGPAYPMPGSVREAGENLYVMHPAFGLSKREAIAIHMDGWGDDSDVKMVASALGMPPCPHWGDDARAAMLWWDEADARRKVSRADALLSALRASAEEK